MVVSYEKDGRWRSLQSMVIGPPAFVGRRSITKQSMGSEWEESRSITRARVVAESSQRARRFEGCLVWREERGREREEWGGCVVDVRVVRERGMGGRMSDLRSRQIRGRGSRKRVHGHEGDEQSYQGCFERITVYELFTGRVETLFWVALR